MFIGFILLIFCFCYGAYANPLWKYSEHGSYFANGIWRALIGIPAWVAVICLMISKWDTFFPALFVTVLLMLLPILNLQKTGNLGVKNVFLLLMASMGVYARILLCWSLIGIPVANMTKRGAEIGISNMVFEWAEMNAKNPSGNTGPSVMDRIFDASTSDSQTNDIKKPEKPEVEVFKEQSNGSMKKMRVNRDSTFYWDPDLEEWVRIKK